MGEFATKKHAFIHSFIEHFCIGVKLYFFAKSKNIRNSLMKTRASVNSFSTSDKISCLAQNVKNCFVFCKQIKK